MSCPSKESTGLLLKLIGAALIDGARRCKGGNATTICAGNRLAIMYPGHVTPASDT
jgi:hypothetical protein